MNVEKVLDSHIDKNSENILLIFSSNKLKALFQTYFNADGLILVTTDYLFKKLDGLRYKEYIFLSKSNVYRLIDEIVKMNI